MDEQTPIRSLSALARAEAACTRCPLYRNATQAVPGEGPRAARLMLVGEQPGDREDIEGKPFVGPAGKLLDRALGAAGVARESLFVTNAVKHFKFEQRGKRRLHKRPNAYEVDRCKLWNVFERDIVRPALVVALGATAARSLFGRPVAIGAMRGATHALPDGQPALVTIHPSALLRLRDSAEREAAFARFVEDLRIGARYVAKAGKAAA